MFLSSIKWHSQLLAFIAVLLLGGFVFAAPPLSPYNPNETLDPVCSPGDTNCIVQLPNGADNLGNHTMTGNLLTNGNWISRNGGNEGIFVGTGGLVGIGKSNPSQGVDNAGWYRSTINGGDVYLGNLSSTQSLLTAATGNDMTLGTGFQPFLSIKPSGNVGIGTNNPASKLQVENNTVGGDSTVLVQNTDTTSGSSTSRFRATSGLYNVISQVYTSGVGYFTGNTPTLLYVGNQSNGPLSLLTDNTSRIYVEADGDVGIGTTTPSTKLNVESGQTLLNNSSGNSLTSNGFSFFQRAGQPVGIRETTNNTSTLGAIGFERGNGSGNDMYISTIGDGANGVSAIVVGTLSNTLAVTYSGNVGIGTTNPGYPLEVSDVDGGTVQRLSSTTGDTKLDFTDAGVISWQLGLQDNLDKFHLYRNNVSLFTFSSTGSLGIGTTSPSDKLEVNGYGKFTSSIKIPGAGASSTGYYACIDGTTGEIYKGGGACTLSDIRLKRDIVNLESSTSLEKVLGLQGVNFKWKESFRGDNVNIGFIAQDVEKIFPEAVTENPDGMKAMNYEFIIAPLVESVKELYNKLLSNDDDIATLKKVIELQQKQIDYLNSKIK